jgi:hypothetical protein
VTKPRSSTGIHSSRPTILSVSAHVTRTEATQAYKRHVGSDNDALTGTEQAALKAAINRAGEPFVLKILSLSRQTLARAVGGLRLRRGTVVLIRQGMQENEAQFSAGGSSNGAGSAPDAAGVADAGAERAGKGVPR